MRTAAHISIGYLRVDGSSASPIMRKLDVTRLCDGDLCHLGRFEQLNSGGLNESVCRSVIGLLTEFFSAQR
jgi:hypothetical protein